jgi:hypothetical protein
MIESTESAPSETRIAMLAIAFPVPKQEEKTLYFGLKGTEIGFRIHVAEL